jgi:hypothetical protein
MASRRILTLCSRHRGLLFLAGILLFFSMLVSSCGTTKKATKEPVAKNAPKKPRAKNTAKALAQLLATNRSRLSDVYHTKKNFIPAAFQEESTNENIDGQNRGYRIQILSSRNASKADTVAEHFRFWADSVMASYVPEAYVSFNRPYYKVRVGNFQVYNRAQELNRLLKNRYPGAWVVHSVIKPNLVPTDSVRFKLK